MAAGKDNDEEFKYIPETTFEIKVFQTMDKQVWRHKIGPRTQSSKIDADRPWATNFRYALALKNIPKE